jgi:glyoxylase-like metal-dependent hydrolase (beta-lactamase superfamily II)
MGPDNTLRPAMPKPTQREIGRGERVLPGVWRLRLPLAYPGVPHCNAWAIAAGDGVVLFDTGAHVPGSMGHLERALEQVGLRVEHVRLVVVTHAHFDHSGEAATIAERAGCEIWMHPRSGHVLDAVHDPEAVLAWRVEVARQSGVPGDAVQRLIAESAEGPPLALPLEADRDLVEGMVVETDLGRWTVLETPGHAPSHVCLHQAERRLLISGDHLLGRVSLYFDYGWTPDPVAEFLDGLDRVEALDARLALSGHGKPFTDVRGHVTATRALVGERLDAVRAALGEAGPLTAFELVPRIYGEWREQRTTRWLINKLLCYLTHLERRGEVTRLPGDPDRWARA